MRDLKAVLESFLDAAWENVPLLVFVLLPAVVKASVRISSRADVNACAFAIFLENEKLNGPVSLLPSELIVGGQILEPLDSRRGSSLHSFEETRRKAE